MASGDVLTLVQTFSNATLAGLQADVEAFILAGAGQPMNLVQSGMVWNSVASTYDVIFVYQVVEP